MWVHDMTSIRFDLDPTLNKALVIGILLFAEAFLVPLYAHLQTLEYPGVMDLVTWIVSATIIEITYMMAFVRTGEMPESKEVVTHDEV